MEYKSKVNVDYKYSYEYVYMCVRREKGRKWQSKIAPMVISNRTYCLIDFKSEQVKVHCAFGYTNINKVLQKGKTQGTYT